MNEIIAGVLALAVPAVLIGSIVLWRTKPVLMMYYALVLVGLGYLTTTGAVEDVGKQALAYIDAGKTASSSAPQAAAPASLSAEPASEALTKDAQAEPIAPPAASSLAPPAASTDAPPANAAPQP